jgi:hypothetical protein
MSIAANLKLGADFTPKHKKERVSFPVRHWVSAVTAK